MSPKHESGHVFLGRAHQRIALLIGIGALLLTGLHVYRLIQIPPVSEQDVTLNLQFDGLREGFDPQQLAPAERAARRAEIRSSLEQPVRAARRRGTQDIVVGLILTLICAGMLFVDLRVRNEAPAASDPSED